MESIVCKLATGELSIFWLGCVAEETDLKLALSENPSLFQVGLITIKLIFVHRNNKGAGQPMYLHSLCGAFVIYFLDSIIARLATC